MSVVSINVCGYFIYLYGCWVISSFFLSIHVSMAGVLYAMVSCPEHFSYLNSKRQYDVTNSQLHLLSICSHECLLF